MRFRAMKLACLAAVVPLMGCATTPPQESVEADREMSVVMRDFSYDPAEIEVTTGEIISFQIANRGAVLHEFLIGGADDHEDHEKQMAAGNEHGAHESDLEGVSVEPGKEATFTFIVPNKGNLIFGCHEPGHYKQGMRGKVTFRGPS